MYRQLTIEEVIQELGDIPFCQCISNNGKGCGQKVKVSPKRYNYYKKHGYPKFLPNHNLIGTKRPEHSLRMSSSGNPMYGSPREDLQEKFKGEGNPMFGVESWNKGLTKETDERVKNVSDKLIGVNVWSKGKKDSLETKKLKSINNSMHNPEVRKKHQEIMDSQEHKEKMSKISIEMWKRPGMKEKISNSLKECYKNGDKTIGYGKRYTYNSPFQGDVCFRSSWELLYAQYLDTKHILWLYEIETFDLGDTTYTPDFFLPQQEKFIEIKGKLLGDSIDKIKKFQDQYPFNMEVLFGEDLENLGINLRSVC